MEYYSTFMHRFRLGKRKQENYVRVPLKKNAKFVYDVEMEFWICTDKDSKFIKCTCEIAV